MKLMEIGPYRLHYREKESDIKTYEEVIGKNVYQKHDIKIEKNDNWMDCGGNVGAFTVMASYLGAKVTCYEPDPNLCKMIELNLKENNLNANIINAALVHNDAKKAKMFFGSQSWRNSLFKNWRGSSSTVVNCLNFYEQSEKFECCKMDIEGAEMPILENTKIKTFNKFRICCSPSF
jgi:FkbM family methyltransferase